MRKDVYLDELIQTLEKEKKLLKKTLKEHLEEGEYRVAHKYSKGLGEITSRLLKSDIPKIKPSLL